MEYVFPAIFHRNADESYTITYPDLPGCISEGKSLANAIYMVESALKQWLGYLADKNQEIPAPSRPNNVKTSKAEFVNLVRAEFKDGRAARRTARIPTGNTI
jgi:predicted RNase H-like HicB family nuclease